MANINIGDIYGTFTANSSDATFVLKAGDKIVGNGAQYGIDGSVMLGDRAFVLDGGITHSQTGIRLDGADGSSNAITVGATGFINATSEGIDASADGMAVVNHGVVATTGAGAAVHIVGADIAVTNDGLLSGGTGIYGYGSGSIVNHGDILADTHGLQITTTAGEMFKIVNEGTISGAERSVYGVGGEQSVTNKGVLNGNVILGDGDDVFRNIGGNVNGRVYGGTGDDRYYLDSRLVEVQEVSGEGYDTVYSSVSWSIDTYVEEVHLVGKKNINLEGDSSGTTLIGNSGRNRIVGGQGGDRIDGGRGNDILTGSDGTTVDAVDAFIFRRFSGKDVITDFVDGSDLINLAGYKGIDDFTDLKGHIRQSGDDVIVSLVGDDQIVLRDMQKADIGETDFSF